MRERRENRGLREGKSEERESGIQMKGSLTRDPTYSGP